jgi:NTP pyrophosphatase (non-canonical NTP hydrolase)
MERMIHNVESLSKTLKTYAGEPSVTNVKNVANEAGDILILLLALAHNVGFDLLVASSDRARTLNKEVNEEMEVLKC